MISTFRVIKPIDGHNHGRETGEKKPRVSIDDIVRRITTERLYEELTMQSLWRDVRYMREQEWRTTGLLPRIINYTADAHQAAIMMPNLKNPILTGQQALDYYDVIMAEVSNKNFRPLLVIQITPATTPEIIYEAWRLGIRFAKFYPKSVTNSEHGIAAEEYELLDDVLAAMEECGMAALFHGEHPDPSIYTLDREVRFLEDILRRIVLRFPRLRVVLEHVSTEAGVQFIEWAPTNVIGSFTTHLAFMTTNDILGHKSRTHNYCRPPAQRPKDRSVLYDVIVGRRLRGRAYNGTDNAAHFPEDKENLAGSPGCFVANEYLSVLAQAYVDENTLDYMPHFTSRTFSEFHELELRNEEIEFRLDPWTVPSNYNGIVPWKAGETLNYRVITE